MTPDILKEYPCAEIEGVEPIFVAAMLKQAMALRYQNAAALEWSEAMDAATATWETDWDSDPTPRTFELAANAVDADLECWDED